MRFKPDTFLDSFEFRWAAPTISEVEAKNPFEFTRRIGRNRVDLSWNGLSDMYTELKALLSENNEIVISCIKENEPDCIEF